MWFGLMGCSIIGIGLACLIDTLFEPKRKNENHIGDYTNFKWTY